MNLCALLSLWCTFTGYPVVLDADTLKVDNAIVRLWGVDAPEMSERQGREARNALIAIIGPNEVRCTDTGERSHRRIVAKCEVLGLVTTCKLGGDRSCTRSTIDLNREIIRSGFALDCARFSKGAYRQDEALGARERLKQKQYCS